MGYIGGCNQVMGEYLHPTENHGLSMSSYKIFSVNHDDVIKWKHFPRNWPFVREIHRSPVNFPHKGQWRGALMFSLIYDWINDWVNNHEAGDLRRQHGHYDVIVMKLSPRKHGESIITKCSYLGCIQISPDFTMCVGSLAVSIGEH